MLTGKWYQAIAQLRQDRQKRVSWKLEIGKWIVSLDALSFDR